MHGPVHDRINLFVKHAPSSKARGQYTMYHNLASAIKCSVQIFIARSGKQSRIADCAGARLICVIVLACNKIKKF